MPQIIGTGIGGQWEQIIHIKNSVGALLAPTLYQVTLTNNYIKYYYIATT